MKMITKVLFTYFLILPAFCMAQQNSQTTATIVTRVSGQILDATSLLPLPNVTIQFIGSKKAAQSNAEGRFILSSPTSISQIKFAYVGYKTIVKDIRPGETQVLNVRMESTKTQLLEVTVRAGKKIQYKNKDNPAVALIQLVINHKESNRMLNTDYLQYNQYERIGFSLFDLSTKFLNGKLFSKYRFLLDTAMVINDSVKTALPIYMSEKYLEVYSRKAPAKKINILKAHQEVNYSSFVDTAAVDLYLNRLYGNPDIYANNIFILTNQFLSPIADHAQDFYKFFITDTIQTPTEKLVEISFTPRNLGDLLFEGRLYITMDGRYAVKSNYLKINKRININFVRRMDIRQDYQQYPDGRFYLTKTNIQSDFGLAKDKGMKVFGDRTVFFTNYQIQVAKAPEFYEGKNNQTILYSNQNAGNFWIAHRTDTLRLAQAQVYQHIDSLQKMPSFKRALWITKLITGGYADMGPVQLGPLGSFYAVNSLEGNRINIGGRTTPQFNRNIYLNGFAAYGFKDQRWKYNLGMAYAFNQVAPIGYPNNYLKINYLDDTDIPGQTFLVDKIQSTLGSITRGRSDLWQYNRILTLNYVKDLESHLSYNVGIKLWSQKPANRLVFQPASQPAVTRLTTTELQLGFRYAPHEQIFKGTEGRHTILSKYPIFNIQASYGIKGLLGGSYDYLNLSTEINKRFYLSQLGYTDVTLLAGNVFGQVPFPYLSILPANQTYLYNKSAYNSMNFLEFVSDHYVGLNATHSFSGFLLNKVPLIKHLKLREYLSLKVLYGGLRNENNPANHPNLYALPLAADGSPWTYALGNTPYTEAGVGIGNIFKLLRIDLIKRFNYLDHSGVKSLGLRFTISPEL
jgi:hypothetical protein